MTELISHIDRHPEALVVYLRGELTFATTPPLNDALLEAVRQVTPLFVVDLTDVAGIDSSGIGTLLNLLRHQGQAGGRLTLTGLPDKVRDVLHVARLDTVFDTQPSVEAALAS